MKDYSTKKRYGNLRTAKETSITKRSPASPFGAMPGFLLNSIPRPGENPEYFGA